MAIIENIINVLVPLLICGLIFIYFRRRITNLEQSVDIIMKMLQTNQLNNNTVTEDDVYVPSDNSTKKVELSADLEENKVVSHDSESDSESDSDSESEESDNSESDSENESNTEKEETDKTFTVEKLLTSSSDISTTNINDLALIEEEEEPQQEETTSKTVVLEEQLTQDVLEKKTIVELKKMLKKKIPDINNLSRMNKSTIIENLMN